MAIALERAPAHPRSLINAGRVLLIASRELLVHGLTGFGRPCRISRRSGRLVRS